MTRVPPNPSGLCMCGCGQRTNRRKFDDGYYRKGDHAKFVKGHTWSKGYVSFDGRRWRIRCRDGSFVYYYRAVAEAKLGRTLAPGEHVHHVNGDCTDDRPENLEVLGGREHISLHQVTLDGRWTLRYAACIRCGGTDKKHAGRGLCSACYMRAWKSGTTGEYPLLNPWELRREGRAA